MTLDRISSLTCRKNFLVALIVLIQLIAIVAIQAYGQEEEITEKPENPSTFSSSVRGPIQYMNEPNISVNTDGYTHKIPYYHVETNSRGMRESPFDKKNPENNTRILVVGDSYTFGWGTNRSQRFTEILEKKLGKEKYQVLNAGVPGWGMEDYYLFLRERGFGYNPDVIVIAFSFNDVLSVRRNNEFRDKAANITPKNAKDRKYKINKKRLELKREFFDKVIAKNSDITKYMKKISELPDDQKPQKTIFYNIKSISKKREAVYDETLEENASTLLTAPKQFEVESDQTYTINEKDPHYNQRGHIWLAKKLYDEIKKYKTNKTPH